MIKHFIIVLLASISLELSSARFEYTWRNSISNSSNITQLPSGDAGNIYTAGIELLAESEEVQDWEFNFIGDISHVWYTAQSLNDEDRFSLSSNINYDPTTSNFSLSLLGDIRQAPINRFQTQEVNNLRSTRLYAVSPNYFFPISQTTKVNINYQHADYRVETDSQIESLQNTPRIEQQATISISTQINSTNNFALVTSKKDTDFVIFSETFGTDYFQYDILGRWIINNRLNQVVSEYGRFRVKDFIGRGAEESQWRILFARQVSRNQSIDIQLSKSVASLFTINQATGNITVNQQNNAITDAQVSVGGGVQYNFGNDFLSLTLGALENELSGLFNDSTEIRRSKSFRATYSLSKLFGSNQPREVTLFLSSDENDFDFSFTNASENLVKSRILSYSQNATKNFTWYFSYSKRSSRRRFIDLAQENSNSEMFTLGFEYREEGKW